MLDKQPQYGDMKTLQGFQTGTKPDKETGLPVPKGQPGRPPQPGSQPQQQQAPTGPQYDPAHEALATELAVADQSMDFWEQMVQRMPSPENQLQYANAKARLEQVALKYYRSTPDFE